MESDGWKELKAERPDLALELCKGAMRVLRGNLAGERAKKC